MKQQIKKFFEFSHTELRGFFILLIIMVLAVLTPFFLKFFYTNSSISFDQEKQSLDSLVLLLENQKVLISEVKQEKKDTIFIKKETPKKVYKAKPKFVKKVKTIAVFELNKATEEELKQINGIGEKLSLRILKYRNKLGGFFQKEQMYNVYGLDSIVVQRLFKYTKIDTSLLLKKRINQPLNKEFFKELLKHPYLEYQDVKAIFAFHKEVGVFEKKEHLIKAIGEEKALRVYLYIDFSY